MEYFSLVAIGFIEEINNLSLSLVALGFIMLGERCLKENYLYKNNSVVYVFS